MNELFETDLKAARYLIRTSGKSSWQLEKLTSISRQTFDRWIKEDCNIRTSTLQDFAEKLGYNYEVSFKGITISKEEEIAKDNLNSSQDHLEIIELQKKHIRLQDKTISKGKKIAKENLKSSQNLLEIIELQKKHIRLQDKIIHMLDKKAQK